MPNFNVCSYFGESNAAVLQLIAHYSIKTVIL